ncbi:MAG: DUF1761 domain-containing protein [Paracoccaceae bacterium]
MEYINVIAATIAIFALGAFWYGTFSKQWVEASGIEVDDKGQPAGMSNPLLFLGSFVMQLIVAGMMRHVLELAGISGIFKGLVVGAGIGLFFITPWIVLNGMYCGRKLKLAMIYGGYATVACAAMGFVLTLF